MRKRERAILAGRRVARSAIIGFSLLAPFVATADENAARLSMSDRIDAHLAAVWQDAELETAEQATDHEFLRRAYLDLTGCIPRISEAEAFLESGRADRRARLIDKLLRRPGHAKHLADAWISTLLPEESNLSDFIMHGALRQWLAEQFAENRAFDQVIREMLLARDNEGAIYFYLSGPITAEALAGRTAESLLGLDLACAECHDHPFASWKREDFWGYAAFFANVQTRTMTNAGIVVGRKLTDDKPAQLRLPGTNTLVMPRYLRGDLAKPSADQTRRLQLATWLTARDNPYFARATVNRVWAMLFGRQLVPSIDPPEHGSGELHGALLEQLAAHFTEHEFDLRELIRAIARSKAYQATSRSARDEPAPIELFRQRAARSLTAGQFHESLVHVVQQPFDAGPRLKWGLLYDLERMAFVGRMQAATEHAEAYSGEVHQALHLMNGKRMAKLTDRKQNPLLQSLLDAELDDEEQVAQLFMATLTRPPAQATRTLFARQITAETSREQKGEALADILWALLNSAEFALNH